MYEARFAYQNLRGIWLDIVSLTKKRDLLMTLEYNKIKNLEEILTPEFFDQLVGVDLCLFFCGLLELKDGYIEHLKIRELLSALKKIVLSVMRKNLCNENYFKLDETLGALSILQVSPEFVTRCLFELADLPLDCVGKKFGFFGLEKDPKTPLYSCSGEILSFELSISRLRLFVNTPEVKYLWFNWEDMNWNICFLAGTDNESAVIEGSLRIL